MKSRNAGQALRPWLFFKGNKAFSSESNPVKTANEGGAKPRGTIYDLSVAQKYVNENVKKFDWATHVIGNYYPKQIRQDFLNVNWYNTELMRIPESTREVSLAMGKLEFWNDSLNQIYQNTPIKEPVSICLHQTIFKNKLNRPLFQKLITQRQQEVNTPTLTDLTQLATFAEGVRTTMIFIFLKLLRIDYEQYPELILAAQNIGKCLGIIDYIKRVPYGLRKYRLYLPEEVMSKYNVSVRNLWDRVEGKPKEDLYDVILEVAAYAKMYLDKSREMYKDMPPQAFRAFLHAVDAEYFLENLEKHNFNIFDRPLHTPSYMVLPYRVFRAARNKRFTLK